MKCYDQEKSGFFSLRLSSNKHFGHNIPLVHNIKLYCAIAQNLICSVDGKLVTEKFLYIRNVAREALIQHSSFLILTLTPQTLFLIDSGVATEYKPASYVPCGKLRCTNHMRCASSTPKYMVI